MKKLCALLGGLWMTIQITVTNVYAKSAGLPNYVKQEVTGKFAEFIDEYNILLSGMWGFFMTSSVLIFIIHFIKLGKFSDNPFARKKIMNDMLITGICTALLGSFGLFFYLITVMVLG